MHTYYIFIKISNYYCPKPFKKFKMCIIPESIEFMPTPNVIDGFLEHCTLKNPHN